jgi:hypothetical protein
VPDNVSLQRTRRGESINGGASAFFIALLASSCATRATTPVSSATSTDLDAETTAVARAEEFVKVNGYVAREDGDPEKIVRESCCSDGGDAAAILNQRAGTLLGAACGVMPLNAVGGPGWTVIFCYDPRNQAYRHAIPDFITWTKERGRAVVIDQAANLRMVHQDILLHAKGSKVLRGMGLLEEILRQPPHPG